MSVCIKSMPAAQGGQKGVSLELKLRVAVSCYMGAGNHTQVFCKSSRCSEPWSHFSSPRKGSFREVSIPIPVKVDLRVTPQTKNHPDGAAFATWGREDIGVSVCPCTCGLPSLSLCLAAATGYNHLA